MLDIDSFDEVVAVEIYGRRFLADRAHALLNHVNVGRSMHQTRASLVAFLLEGQLLEQNFMQAFKHFTEDLLRICLLVKAEKILTVISFEESSAHFFNAVIRLGGVLVYFVEQRT